MLEIALVTHQHNDDIRVGVVLELFEPALDVFESTLLRDVIDEQGANGTAIVGRCDGAIALLAGGVPDLGFDGLALCLDRAGGELDADGRLGFKVEFVASESAQQV